MDTGKLVKFESMPVQGQYDQQALIELLQRLACIPGLADRLVRCLDRFPEVERHMVSFEDRCRSTVSRCESLEMLCRNFLCPGNVNFSQRTMDEYSNRNLIKLKEIVTGLGGDFVNAFPVPPGKKIRLTHKARPGYTPEKIRIDMNIAGGGNNFSDFTVMFFLVPGGVNSDQGLEIGNENDGNIFLNKDGGQLEVPFPEYRGMPLDVGSLETLAVVITNNSGANNLDSAHVNIFYDNTRFYELCKARCGCKTPSSVG
jgi:hypothetical protein